MGSPTLRDLLVDGSNGIEAGDLATIALAEAGRRARRRRAAALAAAGAVVAVAALAGPALVDGQSVDGSDGVTQRPTRSADDGLVGGWEVQGDLRWIPLRNRYHAVTFHAVNRTPDSLPPDRLSVEAAYVDGAALSLACEVWGDGTLRSTTRRQLDVQRTEDQPMRKPVPPGRRVAFTCYQIVGDRPFGDALRIDPASVRVTTE